ncbi:ATP-dependent nuclease [Streptococcus suis]|uniref:ATP-dependent nuclease n=1 Tax=Streptococcus suis TaxID=1307 RepID=UPI000CF6D916|nr:AAA family ATPase [Streptococcus suis]
MRIDEIYIDGYRKFNKGTINLEHGNFAILAGANNSGKTSLIQLLDFVFNNSSRRSLTFNDFSIELKAFLDKKIKELNLSSEFDEDKFMNFIECIDKKIKIKLQLKLSYDLGEPIGLFANYLMDLEDDMHNFYFEYNYGINTPKIRKEFIEQGIKSSETLQEIIERNTESIYFYTDKDFNNKKNIEYKEFKKLFHFEYISADRELDDENLKNKKITTLILSSADSTWDNKFNDLKNKISDNLDDSKIDLSVQEETQKVLATLKDSLDNVSKNEIEALEAKFNFNEKNLLNLIKDSLLISYSHNSADFVFSLTEESQGLGVSNLIYISLQIDKFSRAIQENPHNSANLFVIEEPEAHMHIQMQKVLVSYIETIFSKTDNVQGIITTHSTEIVKNVDVNDIKVIRPEKNFMNRIVDLHLFLVKNGDKEFYETFFKLNFADLIFSDAVIFYEGDAERMYFENLINRKQLKYDNLARQYISYCQCGGAYAHKYFPLLNELGMKACIFTDIDYGKEREDITEIEQDKSTNATLNSLLSDATGDIGSIYRQQKQIRRNSIEIFTQTSKDGFARTLEEAIFYKLIIPKSNYSEVNMRKYRGKLISGWSNVKRVRRIIESKKYNISMKNKYRGVFVRHSRNFWEELKDETNLKFSISNKKVFISIRDIVKSLNKTNFMYSIIMNNKVIEVLPNYIEEGLSWLDKKVISTE